MGMFDSFIDRVGREWQTKELDCRLLVWRLGDTINSEHIPKRGTVKSGSTTTTRQKGAGRRDRQGGQRHCEINQTR